MAYPTVTAPYGFKPINRVDGMPYAGAIRQLPITQAGAIYNGDLVELDIGVFVGCQYTNSSGQTVQAQY